MSIFYAREWAKSDYGETCDKCERLAKVASIFYPDRTEKLCWDCTPPKIRALILGRPAREPDLETGSDP